MAPRGPRSKLQFLVLSMLGTFEVPLACPSEAGKKPMKKTLTSESDDLRLGFLLHQHVSPAFPYKDRAPSPSFQAGDQPKVSGKRGFKADLDPLACLFFVLFKVAVTGQHNS